MSTLDLVIQSTKFSLVDAVEIVNAGAILEAIQRRAIAQWGEDKWLVNLVREYVKIANTTGDTKATPVNRRPQIERAFKVGGCTLDTAIALAAAVGCRFQMACTQVEIETF